MDCARPQQPKRFCLDRPAWNAGAFVATFLGQKIGWYRMNEGAHLIGATVGAVIVLYIWHWISKSLNPGNPNLPPTDRRWL